jgi:release factor glutamine methyltransferase
MDHCTSTTFENVYEPAEDTYLFLDALYEQKQILTSICSNPFVVEIGCGSGMILTYCAKLLNGNGTFIGTDINPHAVNIANQTLKQNQVTVKQIFNNIHTQIILFIFYLYVYRSLGK